MSDAAMYGKKPHYMQATGKMPYSLTNDYLFRALLQKNNRVLKHLICALLHLRPEKVEAVTILNPIVLGHWPERSLSYLCRNFDHLQKGQDYRESKPVVHIGFLDFPLFPEHPEFYATYKMLNVKTIMFLLTSSC